MICPILHAGRMLLGVTLKTYNGQSYGESFNRFSAGDTGCLKEMCEWYGCGCPAHPTHLDIDHKDATRRKLDGNKKTST